MPPTIDTVTNLLKHELTKLFLFILASFIGAAALSPVLFAAGKDLVAQAASEDLSAPLEWLAEKCDRAEFSRYFNRALMAVALLLLYPLIRSLKQPNGKPQSRPLRERIKPQKEGYQDLFVGLILSAGFLTLLALLLGQLGWIVLDEPLKIAKSFKKAIIPAIIVSLLEEWLFRGVLFGVLLRRLRPLQAMIGLSLFFAAVHFLKPPEGVDIENGRAATAGFEMLGLIGLKFLTPASFFGVFLTLFAVGMILVNARQRTQQLWLSIGLHAGWIFSLKLMNGLCDDTGKAPEILYNDSITDGLLPLATLLLTGFFVHLYLKKNHPLSP